MGKLLLLYHLTRERRGDLGGLESNQSCFVYVLQTVVPTLYLLWVARAQGAELLKRLASGSVDGDLMSKYTALAASYCLLRYVENARGLSFADAR